MPIAEIVHVAEAVHGYMDPLELQWLAETARALPPGSAWCEVGSWQGRSATAVAGGLAPGSRLVLVDNFSGPTTRERPNVDACTVRLEAAIAKILHWHPGITIDLHVGESATIARTMPPATFDVIFLDGDHAYAAVAGDLMAWGPALKPKGLFCGHDYTRQCGVSKAVRDAFGQVDRVPKTSIWYARPC